MEIEPSPLTLVSARDREMAVAILDGLLGLIGDGERREIRADDLHRIASLVNAIVLESDLRLTGPAELAHASTGLAKLIAHFASDLREERRSSGAGLMDLVLTRPDDARDHH